MPFLNCMIFQAWPKTDKSMGASACTLKGSRISQQTQDIEGIIIYLNTVTRSISQLSNTSLVYNQMLSMFNYPYMHANFTMLNSENESDHSKCFTSYTSTCQLLTFAFSSFSSAKVQPRRAESFADS